MTTDQDLDSISIAFYLIARCAVAMGEAPATRWPDGWMFTVDKHWLVVVNGHRVPIKCGAAEIPPFHAYVEWNGFPAGLFSPFGGVIAAGSGANEEALVEALEHRLAALAAGKGKG